ncbi:MAG: hypothetical protein V3U65_03420 [Granulosicoccaceae bacterium]
MKSSLIFLTAVSCFASIVPSLAQSRGELVNVSIMDQRGFEKPMVAYTKGIPIGWEAEGGISWQLNTSGCGPRTPHVNWRATAPDGIGMISILPEESWSGHNTQMQQQGGCPNVRITDTKQFITHYAQRHRPNARIMDYRDLTQDVAPLQQQINAQQMPSMQGYDIKQSVGAGQALIAYQVEGREVREIIGTAVMFNIVRMQNPMSGGIDQFVDMMVFPGFAMRMPEGQLDIAYAESIRLNGAEAPEWGKRMAQFHQKQAADTAKTNRKIAAINAKGASDRARINAQGQQRLNQTYNEISDIQMRTYNNTQSGSDRIQRESVEAIGGYETFNDPSNGGTVQLDQGYNYNYQLGDGTNVQTNDGFYNPYTDTGQGYKELEVTQ